jgi:hypothetical protein
MNCPMEKILLFSKRFNNPHNFIIIFINNRTILFNLIQIPT